MNSTTMLIAAALLPALVFCIYVYKKDRVEKEPIGLLLKLLLLGALCCFPAAYAEGAVIDIIEGFFADAVVVTDGQATMPSNTFYVYSFWKYFVGVALIEEAFKWIILVYITRDNKEFNCFFDGLIYAVFVSLGFAALENVFYVVENGFVNAVMRGVMSVPGHMFFGVMMGYQYSMWHMYDKAAALEKSFMEQGMIAEGPSAFISRKNKYLSLLIPVAAHGLYDYCCTIDSLAAVAVLLIFVIFMYFYCFRKIKKMSVADGYEDRYVSYMLADKYPQLITNLETE